MTHDDPQHTSLIRRQATADRPALRYSSAEPATEEMLRLRNFWQAILSQGLQDAIGETMYLAHSHERSMAIAHAREWLESEDFLDVCEHAGLEPDVMRPYVRQRIRLKDAGINLPHDMLFTVSVGKYCEIAKISRRTYYQRRKRGKAPETIRIGKLKRIPLAEIERFKTQKQEA